MFSVLAINVAAPLDPVVVSVIVSCLLLKVVQLAELNAPLLVADAVGTFNVITGVVVPSATVLDKSVPLVPKVKAATLVTVPTPDVPLEPDVPLVPVVPLVPLVPLDPVVPLEPEVPEVPEEPLIPLVPLIPEVPLVPVVPLVPDEPVVPDVPVVPEVPEVPEVPDDPQFL